jgi:hypothetical protein
MTRRGSLIYYLSAWILGCFFMSAAIWIKDLFGPESSQGSGRSVFGLIFVSVSGFVLGALAAFLGAFLLRRIMAALKCKTPSHWAVAGAALTPALIASVGTWERHMNFAQRPGLSVLALLTAGPRVVLDNGWWLAIPAGAATAYLLCRIERRFAPQPVNA